jgi:hypothetical protein
MKLMLKLVLATALCLCSAGMAIGAIIPIFDIDFYSEDEGRGLVQGVYDTDTNLNLEDGQTVSVDILVSGFNDPNDSSNGLEGWGFNLEYNEESLELSNLRIDSNWMAMSPDKIGENGSLLDSEYVVHLGADSATGDGILLFSFDLTAVGNDPLASHLRLIDLDNRVTFSTTSMEVLDGHLPVDLATINADNNPVPVPAAVWLLGSGLTGLLAIRRRKTINKQ